MACENNSESNNENFSILGTWNLKAFNVNPDEVYCPKTLEINSDLYIENEYGGSTCDDLYSFSKSYTYDGDVFTLLNSDIENTNYDIISLTQTELIWETLTPNANQTLKYSYERVE
jgi:hypothetical protein